MQQKDFSKIIRWGLFASFFVYITGWFINLREDHAASYAVMALEMVRSQSHFHFLADPQKVLLPLWLSELSMAVFGSNHIAYRLPGLLPALLSIYSVYRFTKIYYSAEVSWVAALILATTQANFILNAELSTENYQAAFFIFMIWQQAEYLRARKLKHLVLCILGGVLLISSKGILGNPKGNFAPFNLLITCLWSFAPWTLFLFLGLWTRLRNMLLRKTSGSRPEQMSLFGFLIPFVLLSLNPYQSTYDAFIVYPLGAVIAAEYLISIGSKLQIKAMARLYIIQITLAYIVLAILFCIVWLPFPDNNYYGLIHYMALLGIFTWLVFFSSIRNKLLISCLIIAIGSNLVLNTYFYPNMAAYQAGSQLGLLAKADGVKEGRLFSYQTPNSALLHFYSGTSVQQNNDFKNLTAIKNCWVYTHQSFLEEFRALRPDLKIIGQSADLKEGELHIKFLDPDTREETINRMILIRL